MLLTVILLNLVILGQDNPWMTFLEDHVFESEEYLFLELHATAMLCLPSGECLRPDATVCAALMSALYSSVSEEVVLDRQLMVLLSSNVLGPYVTFTCILAFTHGYIQRLCNKFGYFLWCDTISKGSLLH